MTELDRHMMWYSLEKLAQSLDLLTESQSNFRIKCEANQRTVLRCKEIADRDRAQQEEIREANYRVQGGDDD